MSIDSHLLESIFYQSETPMVVFKGPEMIFEMFNDKYQAIYPKRDLLGKPIFSVITELQGSPFPGILKGVYETGKSYVVREGLARIFNVDKNELEDRYFDTTFSRISFGEGEPYRILATPREVTDRVAVRKRLEENLEELQKERELRERFVAALSHDMRTPLAIVKMIAEVLKLKINDPEEVSVMAEKIGVSVDRADRMIRDLLDANRMKAGIEIALSIQNCRLDSIIVNVLSELEDLYGPRFHLNNEIGELNGNWDPMGLHRLLENLVSNAIKYGSPDKKVTITLKQDQHIAEIRIHNEGEVISIEEQKNIFNYYGRSKSIENANQLGWGIGLAVVKGLTEAHGGAISVESHLDLGTTFQIKLPLGLGLHQSIRE